MLSLIPEEFFFLKMEYVNFLWLINGDSMENLKERRGIHHCGEIAKSNGWMFREHPVDDIGIDAHMELLEPSGKKASCSTN